MAGDQEDACAEGTDRNLALSVAGMVNKHINTSLSVHTMVNFGGSEG